MEEDVPSGGVHRERPAVAALDRVLNLEDRNTDLYTEISWLAQQRAFNAANVFDGSAVDLVVRGVVPVQRGDGRHPARQLRPALRQARRVGRV